MNNVNNVKVLRDLSQCIYILHSVINDSECELNDKFKLKLKYVLAKLEYIYDTVTYCE